MKVSYILDQIEQRLRDPLTRVCPVKRPRLMEILEAELNQLSQSFNFPNLAKHGNPLAATIKSQNKYDLPLDFPENFVREPSPPNTGSYSCFVVDSDNNQQILTYLTPGSFVASHDPNEDEGRPKDYTIMVNDDGRRYIMLGPIPDASTYEIHGVYRPDFWEIMDEEDSLALIPNSLAVLTAAVLRIADPRNRELHERDYNRAISLCLMQAAHSSPTRAYPSVARY